MRVNLTVQRHQGRRLKKLQLYKNVDVSSSGSLPGEFFAFYKNGVFVTPAIIQGKVECIAQDGFVVKGLVPSGEGKYFLQEWWCVPKEESAPSSQS